MNLTGGLTAQKTKECELDIIKEADSFLVVTQKEGISKVSIFCMDHIMARGLATLMMEVVTSRNPFQIPLQGMIN
jgi:hypothetical protein